MPIEVRSNEPEVKAEAPAEQKPAPEANEPTEQKAATDSEPVETEEQEESEELEASESDEDGDEGESEQDKPKKKSGIKRRLDKLISQRESAKQELEYWKSQAMKNGATEQSGKEPLKVETKAKADGEPSPDDFETHAEYVKAVTKWTVSQERKAEREVEERNKLQTEQKRVYNTHLEREKSFAKETEDYAEVLAEADYLKDASATLGELIVNSDHGPALMYELAKNPEEYARINQLSPLAAAREIGKLEAKLSKPSEPKPEPRKITKAPRPIEPVGGSKGAASKSPEEMSQAEYEKWRNKKIRERNS